MPSDPTSLDRLKAAKFNLIVGDCVQLDVAESILSEVQQENERLTEECAKYGLPVGLDGLLRHLNGSREFIKGCDEMAIAELEAEASRLTETLSQLPTMVEAHLRRRWGKDGYELTGDPDSVRNMLAEVIAAALESPDLGEVVYERTAGGWEATFHESPEPPSPKAE